MARVRRRRSPAPARREPPRPREVGFISREPVLAEILASRKPLLIGEEGYRWLVQWIADVGRILRARETIAYTVAYTVLNAGMMVLLDTMTRLTGVDLARLVGRGR